MAVLKPDSDNETPNFSLEKDSNSEENSDDQEESNIINSSEPLTEPIIEKNLKKN